MPRNRVCCLTWNKLFDIHSPPCFPCYPSRGRRDSCSAPRDGDSILRSQYHSTAFVCLSVVTDVSLVVHIFRGIFESVASHCSNEPFVPLFIRTGSFEDNPCSATHHYRRVHAAKTKTRKRRFRLVQPGPATSTQSK